MANVKNVPVENKVDCKPLKINKWVLDVVMFPNINTVSGYGHCKTLYCLTVASHIAPSRHHNFTQAVALLQSKPSCYHTTRLHINSASHTSQSRCRNCRDFDVTAMLSSVTLATECCKLRWPINVLERRRVVWSCISATTYVWQNNGKAALSRQHLCAVV